MTATTTSSPIGAIRWSLLPLLALLILVPSTLPVPVLKGFVQERFGLTVYQTAWFMTAQMIGAFVAAPLAGALSDRLGRRKPLIIGALLLDAGVLTLLTIDLPFDWFLLARFIDGALHISALSLLMALASESAPPSRRGRVMGLLGAGLTMGVTLGAGMGGLLGRVDVMRPIYVGAAVSLFAAVLAAVALREGTRSSSRPGLGEALRAIVAERTLLVPVLFAAVDRFTVGFYVSVFPLWLRDSFDFEPPQVGMMLVAFLLPFSLLSYPFGRLAERRSRTLLLCLGSVSYGVGTLVLGFLAPPWLWPVVVGLGVCSAIMFVPNMILTADLAGPQWKGAAMGAFNAAGSLGFACGPLVGAGVADCWGVEDGGYQAAFVVAGSTEVLCVAVALPVLLRLVRSGRTT